MYNKYLSTNIKFFREKENITLLKLSYRAEISKFILQNIEDRKTIDPSLVAITGIAKAMNVSVEDLVYKDFRKEGMPKISIFNSTNECSEWRISENVNNFIECNNLSESEVAKLFNVLDMTVKSLRDKSKRSNVSTKLNLVVRIANAMNISIDELLFDKVKFN